MQTIVNVHTEVLAGSTSRHYYEPKYAEPLIRAHWSEDLDDPSGIKVKAISPKNRYIGHRATRVLLDVGEQEDRGTDAAGEKILGEPETVPAWKREFSRLREKFTTHPRTGGPLFDMIYNEASFKQAYDAALVGKTDGIAPADEDVSTEPADVSALIALDYVGEAYALAINEEWDVTTPEELINKLRPSDLTKLRGVGEDKANNIYQAALKAVHGTTEAPGESETLEPGSALADEDEEDDILEDDDFSDPEDGAEEE